MKLSYDFDQNEQKAILTFYPAEFKSTHEESLAMDLIACVSADFSMDPEFSEEDLQKIIEECRTENKQEFFVEIHEDGIDVEL